MTKLNPLIEAMSSIDDVLVEKAQSPVKKPIRMRVVVIAAAAAAMCLLVGFAVANRHGEFKIGNKPAFEFNLSNFDITIPDEYMPCEENMYNYSGKVDIGVEELFEKFNAPLLINDNFSTDIDTDDVEQWTYRNLNTGEEYDVREEPFIEVFRSDVTFQYYLYEKNLNRNVLFNALYLTEDCNPEFGVQSGVSSKIEEYEILTLNDGSKCFVAAGGAEFSYNGARYCFSLTNSGERSIELTKQVLNDLGVL